MIACASCGTENAAGRKFCGGCGAPLALGCNTCGAANDAGMRFCGECGEPLGANVAASPASAEPRAAERRVVSVLFADLVGFTSLSESRDAEEVRDLLSRYFEVCRRLIEIYGGTVEKFIGDAVMAVWGTPQAQEDDAERAVRAGLELVDAVAQLGDELGAAELRLRAGVMTGEAAVALGAEGQGMVAGDLVNTTSRIQGAAEPGTVLVGEATRRATAAAIAYEPAGVHELKGKSEPVQLYRALRVTSARGGAVRSGELEPPFVGRARELRLVKELFHGAAEDRTAHLVSVVGIGGIGKSRLAWEFEKYLDGVAELAYWHRGRCLAYGDGVAYWALAEMVRMRARIVEDDAPEVALTKLRTMLVEQIDDPAERDWLESRLAHLLGLADSPGSDRQDLFSAWRLFFERLAERAPVVLVFEDLQWADASVLDFVEYLLEWSRAHPLFVLALARPEFVERRPGFGAGSRGATTLSLDPLQASAMEELLDGFVPGLPPELRVQILAQAEGVPLYAVETVRMLLDRGLLERAGDGYRPTGQIEALEVPETLHALVAARLDGLGTEERRLLQDASVLGKSFTKGGLSALSGLTEEALEPVLTSLIRKEVLSVQADPRSPERGQYAFLQDLLKRIAYETMARPDRKVRHLAAAEHFERTAGATELDLVELVAAHYLDAYEAAPDAADAPELRAKAAERLALAGDRASSLAASEEAQRYYEKAAALVDEPLRQASLLEGAGTAAFTGARVEAAIAPYDRAIEIYEAEGETLAAARVTARLGVTMWRMGEIEEGIDRLERALSVLADEEPDLEIAELLEMLGRLKYFRGDHAAAFERIERALEIAEPLFLPEVLVNALNTKSLLLRTNGRKEESLAVLEHAIALAREHGFTTALTRAVNNLCVMHVLRERFADGLDVALEGIEHARRVGNRTGEQQLLGQTIWFSWLLGDWKRVAEARDLLTSGDAYVEAFRGRATILLSLPRGDVDEARRALDAIAGLRDSADAQLRAGYLFSEGLVLRAEGRPAEAAASIGASRAATAGLSGEFGTFAWSEELESAFDCNELDRVDELLGEPGERSPSERTQLLQAQHARFSARLLAERGQDDGVEELLRRSAGLFRSLQMPYQLAIVLLELAEWLGSTGRGDEAAPLLDEARETFARLDATLWLERVAAASRSHEPVPAGGR